VPNRLPLTVAAVALSASMVLASCGSGDHTAMDMGGSPTPSTSSTTDASTIPADAEFNATDVAFAQGMIPHHAQAVDMADMALARSSDAQIKELAGAIKAAQQPEIDQLTAWLQGWGQPVPDTSAASGMDHSNMGHSDMDHSNDGMAGMMMEGMMSAKDMDLLAGATGVEFDRLWLEMMIRHHEGAVAMALTEQEAPANGGGKFPAARAMALDIITTQNAEITLMTEMLAGLGD
jgi:uncharacterized protein (DUF305 family)